MASEEGVVVETPLVSQSKYSRRVVLKTILDRCDGGLGLVGQRVVVGGWVKSSKDHAKDVPQTTTIIPREVSCVEILQSRIPLFRSIIKAFSGSSTSSLREKLDSVPAKAVPSIAYLQVNDGSCVPTLLVVVDSSLAPLSQLTPTGTSILVVGVLKQPSVSGKYVIELKVEKILDVGIVDHAKYPLAKTRLPLENLRGFSHLRPRTTTVASVTRIRSSMTQATHTFFQSHGFLYVHTPIITSTDSIGSSEKFQVTTLAKKDKKEESNAIDDTGDINLEVVKAAIKEKSSKIEELKRSDSNREALFLALQDLQKANELAFQLVEREKPNSGNLFESGKVGPSENFFPRQMYLTVSGQLHLESYACALGSVYTFGPTFQAEKSQSKKYLAELWMVELEIAFADLEDAMNCAEDYVKFLCQWVLENCSEDLKFVSKRIDKTTFECLQSMASSSFEKITYTEAVELFKQVTDKTFEANLEWGVALSHEHESYLADKMYKKPVIIYDCPKEVKPFFARLNDDGKTVATIDLIVPKVGTLIRGSQREERLDILSTRIKELGLPREQYEWYLDLRRHGTVKHSGFSLGFDNMVLFATGLTDISDAIPFPISCDNTNY